MDIIAIASTISGLTGFSLKDVLEKLSPRGTPIKLIASAYVKLLAMLTSDDDELTGCWYVSKWRYFWKEPHVEHWEESPYHVDGYLYVFYRYQGELRWKATMILNYTWRRGRVSLMPEFLRNIFDRSSGKSFKGAYDVEIRKNTDGCYSGTSTMIFRLPDLGARYSGVFENLRFQPEGILEGTFKNIDPLPGPKVDGKSEVALQQRKRWDEIEIEGQGIRR